MSILEEFIEIPVAHEKNIFGQFDAFAKKIERTLQVTLIARDGHTKILGEAQRVNQAKRVLEQLAELSKRGNTITEQNVDYAISLVFEDNEKGIVEIDKDIICQQQKGKHQEEQQQNQKRNNRRLTHGVDIVRQDGVHQILSNPVGKGTANEKGNKPSVLQCRQSMKASSENEVDCNISGFVQNQIKAAQWSRRHEIQKCVFKSAAMENTDKNHPNVANRQDNERYHNA